MSTTTKPACVWPASHHSDDVTEVWHGSAEPLYACGYHLQSVGVTRLAEVKSREAVSALADDTLLTLLAMHGARPARDERGNLRELTYAEIAFGKALRLEVIGRGLIS